MDKHIFVWIFIHFCLISQAFAIFQGAEERQEKFYQYMASIRLKAHDKSFGVGYICNGVLIGPKSVLTSKQCIYNYSAKKFRDASELTIVLGSPHRVMMYKTMLHVNVNEIIRHKDSEIDLAILRLNTEIKDTEGIKIIPIKPDNETTGLKGDILGWGEIDKTFSAYTIVLKKLAVTVADNEKCKSLEGDIKQNSGTICVTGESTGSTCNGDLGAPFVVNNELVGFVSVETACNEGKDQPAILTLVSFHKKWIDSKKSSGISLKIMSLVTLLCFVIGLRFL